MRCGGGELTRTVYREGHFSGVTSVVPLLVLIDRGTFSSTSAVACSEPTPSDLRASVPLDASVGS